MLGALSRAWGRLFQAGSNILDRLRGTLASIDPGEERTLMIDNNGPACEMCRPLHGAIIRVRNGVPDGDLPPFHPHCDCVARPQ